jgi:hypothetical protein
LELHRPSLPSAARSARRHLDLREHRTKLTVIKHPHAHRLPEPGARRSAEAQRRRRGGDRQIWAPLLQVSGHSDADCKARSTARSTSERASSRSGVSARTRKSAPAERSNETSLPLSAANRLARSSVWTPPRLRSTVDQRLS